MKEYVVEHRDVCQLMCDYQGLFDSKNGITGENVSIPGKLCFQPIEFHGKAIKGV